MSVLLSIALAVGVGVSARSAGARPDAATTTLRIVFPEGFSARQMIDRVAEVRRIAIRRRHVTPRLTGKAYAAAVATTPAPRAFRRYLKRRSVEGFLFPSLYEFTPTTPASRLVANQIAASEKTGGRTSAPAPGAGTSFVRGREFGV